MRRRGLERKLYLFPFSTSNEIINSHRTDTTSFINYPWVSFEIKYLGKKNIIEFAKKMKSDISQLPDFSLTERKCQEYVMIIIDKNFISSLHLDIKSIKRVQRLAGVGNTTNVKCEMMTLTLTEYTDLRWS